MTMNDEIINNFAKRLVVKRQVNPDNKARLIITIELNDMLNEARADGYSQGRRDALDAKWEANKKKLAKDIFSELDGLCGDTGAGLGLDLEDALSNNARDSEKFREHFIALKKKLGIE